MARQDQTRTEFTYLRIALAAGEVVSVWTKQPLKLVCEQGRLWLTQDGAPGDHWLRPGLAWYASVSGQVVVEGSGLLRLAGASRHADFRLRWNDDAVALRPAVAIPTPGQAVVAANRRPGGTASALARPNLACA